MNGRSITCVFRLHWESFRRRSEVPRPARARPRPARARPRPAIDSRGAALSADGGVIPNRPGERPRRISVLDGRSVRQNVAPDFYISDHGGASNKRNVLLVVAHPDDESMFFSPTISYLTTRGHNLHILCLSVGNADGLGTIRKEELYRACAVLNVPHQQIKVLDHPDLQDGFGKIWSHSLLLKIIEEELMSNGIDAIITFDSYGVSGHCNHQDVHRAVRKLQRDTSQRDIEAWELVSTSIVRKYSGPVDIWISSLSSSRSSDGSAYCVLNEQPWRSFRAMSEHSSQWVWFRKLFVSFSSYTYINMLRRIDA